MDQVIEGLKANKEKAQAIIDKANERHDEMIARIPFESKDKIKGIKEQNAASLAELKAELEKENAEKEAKVQEETREIIKKQEENSQKHQKEIADILYNIVITVPDE